MYEKIKKYLTVNNIVLIIATVLALSWAVGSIGVMNRNYDLQRQVDQANLNNQIIDLQNQNLKLEQAYYQTDEFLDLQARALLGKANLGEHLVLLPRNDSLTVVTDDVDVRTEVESNFGQWMDFLVGSH